MLYRKVKTFGRKSGRMSGAEKAALEELLPGLLIPELPPVNLNDLFGREASTFVEIGFGSGYFLFDQAVKHPEFNYIGVEIYLPGIAKLLRKIQRYNTTAQTVLNNIRIARHEAAFFLREFVPPHSLSGVYILFPDPWPKKRHHKRRLINPSFTRLLKERLLEDGIAVTATDHQGYAEVIREAFLEAGFRPGSAKTNGVFETKYARKALSQGANIHCFAFET
jgi:tRNA (guanine-N7-)-methyltransferase